MIPHGVEVFVALEPIDLRWSFDRLSGIVEERIGREARSGASSRVATTRAPLATKGRARLMAPSDLESGPTAVPHAASTRPWWHGRDPRASMGPGSMRSSCVASLRLK